jgi:hypothetical protein
VNATVAKYLASWSEPGLSSLAERLPHYYAALTVPLLGESSEFLAGCAEALSAARGRVLLVAVINAAIETSTELRAQNAGLLRELTREAQPLSPSAWLVPEANFDLLLLDRSSVGLELPRRQGVGLARKLAGDVALSLFARGKLELPFVFMTDADATLPKDYFARAERERTSAAGALIYPFEHVAGDALDVHRATQTYEALLRYHVLGLGFAGSPYAHHTVGSTLAVHTEAYATVRGVPKRAAGEDFYLLDKISKVSKLRKLGGEPIAITSRRSARVPFGTGPRVEQILTDDQALVACPEAFLILKQLLAGIERVAARRAVSELGRALSELPPELQPAAKAALHDSGLEGASTSALAAVGQGNLRRRLHTWFDALRTLKFLHALRALGLPDVPLEAALASAPFCPPKAAQLELTLARLREAEARLPNELGPALC